MRTKGVNRDKNWKGSRGCTLGWYGSLIFCISLLLIAFYGDVSSAADPRATKNKFYALRGQCIHALKNPTVLRSQRHIETLTSRCLSFQKKYPASAYATRALYLAGMLWEGHYRYTKHVSDWNQALRAYSKVIALYPNSWLADDALFRRGILYLKLDLNRLALTEFRKLLERYPHSDLYRVAQAHVRRLTKKRRTQKILSRPKTRAYAVAFNGFRYWSNDRYARVVMDFSSKVPFHYSVVRGGKRTKLILTLDEPFGLRCSKRVIYGKRGEFFRVARLKKYPHSSTITILFASEAQCKVFPLLSPYRIVVDAVYKDRKERYPAYPPYKKKGFLICLDPGHGGRDPGATGPRGVKEKDVVLRIAKILREKLRKRYGFRVIMTRDRDVFIPLEQRVAFANSKGADLFISIHINASRNRRLQGISTFCLSNTSDMKSLRLAARENGVPLSKMSSVDKILNDMLFSEKYNESYKVAHLIHQALIQDVRRYNARIHNLGVRFAPFYVLAGAKMPSILLELDFISNPYGEKRLVRYAYLDKITDGIAKGIEKTTKSVHLAQNFFN